MCGVALKEVGGHAPLFAQVEDETLSAVAERDGIASAKSHALHTALYAAEWLLGGEPVAHTFHHRPLSRSTERGCQSNEEKESPRLPAKGGGEDFMDCAATG